MKATLSEKQFQLQVLQLAKLYGWRCAHFRPAQTRSGKWITPVQAQGKGFPDLLMLRGGRQVVAELKVGKNKPSAEQTAWLDAFTLAHVQAFVWFPTDWRIIEETLR